MFDFMKKKSRDSSANRQRYPGSMSIAALSATDKQDILSMREDGLLPSQIAEELGFNSDQVSKVIQLQKERQARQRTGSNDEDPLGKINLELKQMDLEMRRDELRWRHEDRKAERQAEIDGPTQEMIEGLGGEDDSLISKTLTQIALGYMTGKNQTQNPGPGSASYPGQGTDSTPPPIKEVDLTQAQVDQILEEYKQHLPMVQKLDDQTIGDIINSRFPGLSEGSIKMIIDTVKKKEVVKNRK